MGKLVLGEEGSAPSAPDAGDVVLYFVGDILYVKFTDGTEVKLGTKGGLGSADMARFAAANG